jgi:hypothetical protein
MFTRGYIKTNRLAKELKTFILFLEENKNCVISGRDYKKIWKKIKHAKG